MKSSGSLFSNPLSTKITQPALSGLFYAPTMPHCLIRCAAALSQHIRRLFHTLQFNLWALTILCLDAWAEFRRANRMP